MNSPLASSYPLLLQTVYIVPKPIICQYKVLTLHENHLLLKHCILHQNYCMLLKATYIAQSYSLIHICMSCIHRNKLILIHVGHLYFFCFILNCLSLLCHTAYAGISCRLLLYDFLIYKYAWLFQIILSLTLLFCTAPSSLCLHFSIDHLPIAIPFCFASTSLFCPTSRLHPFVLSL